jgi:hypothetical protein
MSILKLKRPHKGVRMPSTNYTTHPLESGTQIDNSNISPFDNLALEYDAWFDREGSLIFAIEVQAFRELLPSLPRDSEIMNPSRESGVISSSC